MTRLFIDNAITNNSLIELNKDDSHYLSSVLRMRIGEELTIVDGDGKEAVVTVESIDKNSVSVRVGDVHDNDTEPAKFITLYQSVSKGERMDLTIQKSVELGVSRIVPVWSERCIARSDKASKIDRWQKIALEAARQSQRGIVPEVTDPLNYKNALSSAREDNDLVLFPWEEAQGLTLKGALAGKSYCKIGVFIGPEGGFSQEEADMARENDALPVTLGRRILRTETAGPAVLAMILYDTEL